MSNFAKCKICKFAYPLFIIQNLPFIHNHIKMKNTSIPLVKNN